MQVTISGVPRNRCKRRVTGTGAYAMPDMGAGTSARPHGEARRSGACSGVVWAPSLSTVVVLKHHRLRLCARRCRGTPRTS